MRCEIESFVQHTSNTLQGFFTVYFPEAGISMPGFSLHQNTSGAKWVEFPAKLNKKGEWEKVILIHDTKKEKKLKKLLLTQLDVFLRSRAEEDKTSELVLN